MCGTHSVFEISASPVRHCLLMFLCCQRPAVAHVYALAETLAAFKAAQRKRSFLLGFATEPEVFVRKLVAASAKDVRTPTAVGASAAPDISKAVELSAADNFKQPWAQEAAIHYLDRLESARRKAEEPAAVQPAAAPK